MGKPSETTPAEGWDASTYHRVSAPQELWGRQLAKAYDWRGDERVMDAGCGSGRVSVAVLDRIPDGRLIGVDMDANMIDRARESLAGPLEDGKAELHQGDLLEFAIETPVDVVFSNAVFHWILDHDRLWKRVFSWLKPGGRLWTQCGGQGNLTRSYELVRELSARPPYIDRLKDRQPAHCFASVEETRARLHCAGFEELDVYLEEMPAEFKSAADFEPFNRSIILRHLREPLGDDLWDRFVGEWLERHLDLYGTTLDYVRLNVRARRPLK